LNTGNPASLIETQEIEAAARSIGIMVVPMKFRLPDDLASAFQVHGNQLEAVYVCADPVVNANRSRISTLALGVRRR
jgi:ABC-type uncharacterized transport system substrate-binding protein